MRYRSCVASGVPQTLCTKFRRKYRISILYSPLRDAGRKYGSVLFSTHARRLRHQWKFVVEQLSGLSLPGSRRNVSSGELRTLDLEPADRIHADGRRRQGRSDTWRSWFEPVDSQFCDRPYAARWRLSAGLPVVFVGRQRRHSYDRERQHLSTRRHIPTIVVLIVREINVFGSEMLDIDIVLRGS